MQREELWPEDEMPWYATVARGLLETQVRDASAEAPRSQKDRVLAGLQQQMGDMGLPPSPPQRLEPRAATAREGRNRYSTSSRSQ